MKELKNKNKLLNLIFEKSEIEMSADSDFLIIDFIWKNLLITCHCEISKSYDNNVEYWICGDSLINHHDGVDVCTLTDAEKLKFKTVAARCASKE